MLTDSLPYFSLSLIFSLLLAHVYFCRDWVVVKAVYNFCLCLAHTVFLSVTL